ncbi:hypothetical protein tpqmel_0920 [Candidatus Gastranaerophilus sp. (ex Termes propinquus)]|nr:hypothetical protein tpqmel_0920 [Candidatus Gastranaerophilus sp. (ex Termes propinquus)]
MDFAQALTLKGVNVDENDALFFLALVDSSSLNIGKLQNFSAQEIIKSTNVSKTLVDLLSSANSIGKPVRIDFDNAITLVLRIDRDGKLNAQFFPGDRAAQEYLRHNIPYLKNRFDEQNIQYTEISYKSKQHKGQQDKENKK